jgi:hypothetical protein
MTVERSPKRLITITAPGRKKIVVRKTDPGELPQVLAELNRSASASETRQRIANNARSLYQFANHLAVVGKAKSLMDSKFVTDGKTPDQIRREVVDAKMGDSAKGWSDEQVAAVFASLTPEKKKPKKPLEADEEDAVLDLERAATTIIKQLARVEAYLNQVVHGFEKGQLSLEAVLMLLDTALVLPTLIEHLIIVDNENAIVGWAKQQRGFVATQADRSSKTRKKHESWQAHADPLFERHPDWGESQVARRIAPVVRANWNTIRRHIKKPQPKL